MQELVIAASDVGRVAALLTIHSPSTIADLSVRVQDLLPEAVILDVYPVAADRKLDVAVAAEPSGAEPGIEELFRDYLAEQGTRGAAAGRVMATFSKLLEAINTEQDRGLPRGSGHMEHAASRRGPEDPSDETPHATFGLRSYRSEATIDFGDPGLIAIVGDTGAGKSSILEAIFFALYGGCTWDHRATAPLISDGGSLMQVELVFLAEGRRWRVFRSASRTSTQNRHELQCLDDPGYPLDNDVPVTTEIKRLIGLDQKAFLRP